MARLLSFLAALLLPALVACGSDAPAEDAGHSPDTAVVRMSAAEFADASPLPDPATLYEHAYATINEHGRLFLDGRAEAPRAADEG